MNAVYKFGFQLMLLITIAAITYGVSSFAEVGANRRRLGDAERTVDDTTTRLAEQQRLAIEFVGAQREGLDTLKGSIEDGTRSLATRIRQVAKDVAILEDRLSEFERSVSSGSAGSSAEVDE